jgi:Protein of unknown function (DUF3726)
MIDASLNEVEALATKAARGAGLSWGLCEDAGKATRWLAACGVDWSPSLIVLLSMHGRLRGPLDNHAERALSPLLAGTYIADLQISDTSLQAVAYPLWLLPFAGRIAAEGGTAVRVSWGWLSITVWPNGGDVAGPQTELAAPYASQVVISTVRPGQAAPGQVVALPRQLRSSVRTADWHALEALGARTYVPASAQSRAKGAGAGLVDND